MVGFIQESCKEGDESAVNQQKIKNSNNPESLRFDFEGYSSEFGGFSLASAEPFLDFDSIKDWIEEMQVPDSAPEAIKAETESGVCVESCLEDQSSSSLVDSVQGMNGSEKTASVNAEFSVPDEDLASRDGRGSGNSLVKLDGMVDSGVDSLTMKAELGTAELAGVDSDGHLGDRGTSHADMDESSVQILVDKNCPKVESLGCSIEEGLEKVTLIGDEGGLVVTDSHIKKVDTPVIKEDSDSDSDSESESQTSSSSSGSESDDDDEEELKAKNTSCKSKNENTAQTIDMEEGQIVDSDAENMVSWFANEEEGEEEDDDVNFKENSEEFHIEDEDEDADIVKGPIKSKNELEVLPPVPPVNVTLQPCHEIMPVGVVSSVLGTQIVVEGSEKHDPLSEGSILWVAETRLPLGLVDEIFGPVKTPFYIVRHNSESEVPSGIQTGTSVGYVPEFVGHVLNDKSLYQKGYDASGENDEEVLDENDFSDDEKEAEYKRMLKMSKRGNNNQVQGSGNKNKKNKNRDKTWTKDQPSSLQSPTFRSSQPIHMQQHGPRVPIPSQGNQLGPSPIRQVTSGRPAVPPSRQGNQSGPSPIRHVISGGNSVPPLLQGNQLGPSQMQPSFPNGPMAFPPQMQQAGPLLNGYFANGVPFQQQNMALPGGFQMNNMPWLQQNHPPNFQVPSAGPAPWQQQQHVMQMPLSNPAQCQQPFDLSQLASGSAQTPLGPSNFSAGPPNAPWVGMLGQNLSNQPPQNVGLQGASQLPAMQGQSLNSQPWLGMLGQNLSNQASQNIGLQGSSQLPVMQVQGQNYNSQPWLGMFGQNFSNQTQQNVGPQGTNQLPAMQGQSFNSQPRTSFHGNEGSSPQFSQGSSSGRGGRGGRGRGRRPFHHRGGHSGSGRGHQQPN